LFNADCTLKPLNIQDSPGLGVALGNITNFASIDVLQGRNWRNHAVVNRYRLQDHARELLPDHRVTSCLRVPVGNNPDIEIWQDSATGHAHLKGVGKCGSYWVCPVCSTKITLGRRNELQEAMSRARALGWYPVFVTFTSRHSRDDNLVEMRTRTRKAQRALKSGRWWQDNVSIHGLEGVITGIEPTWGFDNGWHVHYHAVMFFSQWVDLSDLENRLFMRWYQVLQRYELDCDRDHGVKVLPGNAAAAYITKWGLENELANPDTKQGREGHFTPFQLLTLSYQGEKWAGILYQEFSLAFHGVSQLRWSKGLRDKLGMGESATDQELSEEETSRDSVRIAKLTWDEYRTILSKGRRGVVGEILVISECGSEALKEWLFYKFTMRLGEIPEPEPEPEPVFWISDTEYRERLRKYSAGIRKVRESINGDNTGQSNRTEP
jgi:hypothetical protein